MSEKTLQQSPPNYLLRSSNKIGANETPTAKGAKNVKGRKLKFQQKKAGEQGEDDVDFGVPDFTTYLERQITKYHHDIKGKKEDKITLEEEVVVKFLKYAEVKFMGFSNHSRKIKQPKRLVSCKTSVFKNKTKNAAQYILRASTEDTVMAQVSTRKGFSLGVATGLNIGSHLGGGGIQFGGSYHKEKEEMQGSSSASRREMEASAKVGPNQQLVATESVYAFDYEAECSFDFSVKEDYAVAYKVPRWKHLEYFTKNKEVKVKQIGFKECNQEGIPTQKEKRVHLCTTFHTTLTGTEHEIDFEVEPLATLPAIKTTEV